MNTKKKDIHYKTTRLERWRYFFFVIFFLLFGITVILAQEATPQSTVYLKNGDVFKGRILMSTDEVMMIQTDDGKRYQFLTSEIERISEDRQKKDSRQIGKESNFGVIIDLEGGIANASTENIRNSPLISGSAALGTKNLFNSNTFAGLGTGVEFIFPKNEGKNLILLPIFIQLNKTFTDNPIKPFIGTKTGYSFGLNKEYKGGVFIKLSGGANFSISEKTSVNLGVFGKIQQISGLIIEKNEWGEFVKNGTTPLYSIGLNFAFIF